MEDGEDPAAIFVHPGGKVKGCVSGRESSSMDLSTRGSFFFRLHPVFSQPAIFRNGAFGRRLTIRPSGTEFLFACPKTNPAAMR